VVPDKFFRAICVQVIRLLTEERKRRGLSKYAMAHRAGLSEQMIGYVERGLRKPSFETILRMASALDVDLEDIIREARKALPKAKP
jgi:transcriptional regulator with XRE-family HTH domain